MRTSTADPGPYLEALRAEFPGDTVEVTPGYGRHVHALVVSSRLNGMSELEKHAFVREVLRTKLGARRAAAASMVVAYGTDELR